MFIGRNVNQYRLRSEEGNSCKTPPLQNLSAFPNGAGGVLLLKL
jgi:hypothetical protein